METKLSKVSIAGARESLVRRFSVEGLFGYRTLSFQSEFAATVLIAHNGAGKTTLLGALDAFLRGQFGRLAELSFERLECELRNVNNPLVLLKSELDDFLRDVGEIPEIARLAKQHELDAEDILFFVLWELPTYSIDRDGLYRHQVFRKVYQNHPPYTLDTALNLFNKIRSAIVGTSSPILRLHATILNALKDIDIVYLPTYRRIELSLPQGENRKNLRGEPISINAKLGLHRRGVHAGDIQFGLSDISARLTQLNQEIISESNQKYGEISANIIDDLISQDFEEQHTSLEERPSRQELDIFFERMKSGRRYYGYSYSYKMPDFDRIYSGNVPASSEKFLTYFLGKLNTVIQKTRETEKVVDSFRESCNRYLSAREPSTELRSSDRDLSDDRWEDSKELRLNRANLDVSVWRTGKREIEIPLDALSSGEKQMVSLFARLYLYPKQKLVLIDEPELSLSIDWQQKILPDIVNAPLCRQAIAITHSPFIFDNDLDAFATPLGVTLTDPSGDVGV